MNKTRNPKASDISDEEMLGAIRAARGMHGVPHQASRWDIERKLPQWPAKVVCAKAASMIRRGLIDGCVCGCRGDYEILDPWDRFVTVWTGIASKIGTYMDPTYSEESGSL